MNQLRRLIHEIHRRSLWQVLGIYIVSGWVAYQVIESLTDGLGLPPWLPAVAIVILIAGLPIVLATAFVQEGAPADAAEPGGGARVLTWRNTLVAGFATLLLLAVVVVSWTLIAGTDPGDDSAASAAVAGAGALDPARVAVLYFDDLSPDGDLGYLAAGFTEALIHELSQVQRLRIVSRNGVKPYRDADVSIDSIARALSAGTLVEGSIESAGDRLRVIVQLIDGTTGAHLLSRRLERQGDDVLALRDEIVREAAILLRQRLGEQIQLRTSQRAVEDAEAWAMVQRAMELHDDAQDLRRSGASDAALRALDAADSVLADAARRAPRWPVPVIRRGEIEVMRAYWASGGHRPSLDSARSRAEHALALAPGNPEALHLVGMERFARVLLDGWPADAGPIIEEAERALRASLDADADRANTWALLSAVLQGMGRFEEAYQAAERALDADPFLEDAGSVLHQLCATAMERDDEVDIDRHCTEALRRFPDSPEILQLWLWKLALDAENGVPVIDSAWSVMERALANVPADRRSVWRVDMQILMAGIIASTGSADSARAVLRRARSGVLSIDARYAEAYALLQLGERDSALASLRQLVAARPSFRTYLTRDRAWEDLWDDPAFQALVRQP